ncbi:MAG TPA: DUF1127 domain-containing protein [Paracoccaceae bacterium]|nr:DUF1127 domain-containing protein [Paracoccaceae bacterium]
MSTEVRTGGSGIIDSIELGLAALFDGARRYLRRAELRAQTRRELQALSDRDLADLGISRCDIDRIAHEAARDV